MVTRWIAICGLLLAAFSCGGTVRLYTDAAKDDKQLRSLVNEQAENSDRFDRAAIRVRSQNCTYLENEHYRDVKALADTYDYLADLTPDQESAAINQYIVSRLAETEAKAAVDSAPKYCDRVGLGRPEPDPCVPERPLELGGDSMGPVQPCKPIGNERELP